VTLFASVSLDAPVLETSLERAPEATVTLKQQTPTEDGSIDLTLWAGGDDLDAFERGLDADGTVARWVAVGGTDERKLYRTRLSETASSSLNYHRWTDGQAVFLSVEREVGRWTVDAYFPDRSVLQQFEAGCEASGVQFDLLEVAESDGLQDTQQFGLTQVQAETLLTALDRGYYSIPRQVNLEELAAPLDVSHQAVSERLRRGVGSLIETTVAEQSEAGTESDASEAPSSERAPEYQTIARPVGLEAP
jgi:hypothetical protein